MAEIRLAHGKGIALIDDEDSHRVPLTGWCLQRDGYAVRQMRQPDGSRRNTQLHRLVLNAPKGQEVDHINHNKLDCRKANLRFVTKSQNMQNQKGALRTSRTGVRGVIPYETKSGTRFCAGIEINGKHIRRFGFTSLADAEAAAIELRRTHFTHSQECG